MQTDRRGVVRVTRALTLACVLVTLSWSRVTEAHGGNPRAYDIVFDPADPNDIFLKFDFWGAARTRDGGKTWQYACSELWGVHSTETVTTSSLIAPGGRLLVAAESHGLLVTDDFCSWQRVSALAGNVYDIQRGNSGLLAIGEVSRLDASVSTAQGGVFQSKAWALGPPTPACHRWIPRRRASVRAGAVPCRRPIDAAAAPTLPSSCSLRSSRVGAAHAGGRSVPH